MPVVRVSRLWMAALALLVWGWIGVTVAGAQGDPTPTPTPTPPGCAECHVDVVAAWQGSTHAQAYSSTTFQEAWRAQNQKADCLACHTTGYVARSGEYAHEGITCEACHGQTPVTHPPDAVAVNPGVETCATCHPTTYTEWQHSAHGEQQLACVTCHQPHPAMLRFATSNELCMDCHADDALDDYAHLVHPDEDCVSCHWFRPNPADLAVHAVSGDLYPTGHSGPVLTQSCIVCHEEITESEVMQAQQETLTEMELDGSKAPLAQANVRIKELEARVDTVKAQGSNSAALRLVQGVIVGLAVGGVAVAGVLRFRQRSARRMRGE